MIKLLSWKIFFLTVLNVALLFLSDDVQAADHAAAARVVSMTYPALRAKIQSVIDARTLRPLPHSIQNLFRQVNLDVSPAYVDMATLDPLFDELKRRGIGYFSPEIEAADYFILEDAALAVEAMAEQRFDELVSALTQYEKTRQKKDSTPTSDRDEYIQSMRRMSVAYHLFCDEYPALKFYLNKQNSARLQKLQFKLLSFYATKTEFEEQFYRSLSDNISKIKPENWVGIDRYGPIFADMPMTQVGSFSEIFEQRVNALSHVHSKGLPPAFRETFQPHLAFLVRAAIHHRQLFASQEERRRIPGSVGPVFEINSHARSLDVYTENLMPVTLAEMKAGHATRTQQLSFLIQYERTLAELKSYPIFQALLNSQLLEGQTRTLMESARKFRATLESIRAFTQGMFAAGAVVGFVSWVANTYWGLNSVVLLYLAGGFIALALVGMVNFHLLKPER